MLITTDDQEENLLRQMVETIVGEVAPETIILFGSRARGEAHADSDVDLLVVETEAFSPQRSRRKEAARLYMALRCMAYWAHEPKPSFTHLYLDALN